MRKAVNIKGGINLARSAGSRSPKTAGSSARKSGAVRASTALISIYVLAVLVFAFAGRRYIAGGFSDLSNHVFDRLEWRFGAIFPRFADDAYASDSRTCMLLFAILATAVFCGIIIMLIMRRRPQTAIVLVVVTVFCAASVFVICKAETAESPVVSNVRIDITKVADDVRYRDADSVLPQGNFEKLGKRKMHKGDTKLEVVMDSPDSLYLRGFVGEAYIGNAWTKLSAEEKSGYADLFARLHASGFYGQTQLAGAATLVWEDEEASRIDVKNVGESSRFIYAPYEANSRHSRELRNGIGDSDFPASGLTGEREYSYYAIPNTVSRYTDIATALSGATKNTTADSTTATAAKESEVRKGQSDGTATAESESQKLQGDSTSAYLASESHYSKYVYAAYTKLPPAADAMTEKYFGKTESESEAGSLHPPYSFVKQKIVSFLTQATAYSENVDSRNIAPGADFFQSFIEKEKRGYDVHYASAATLIFRHYGIPARYVEGYLITPEDVDGAEGRTLLSLDSTHAHAWAEYYADGIGWIPFEASPPYLNIMKQPEDSASETNGDGSLSQLPVEEPQNTEEKQEERQGSRLSSAITDSIRHALPYALMLLGAALLAGVLAVVIRRSIIMRRRRALLTQSDIFARAQSLTVYAFELMNELGLTRRNVSLFEQTPEMARLLRVDETAVISALTAHRRARFASASMEVAAAHIDLNPITHLADSALFAIKRNLPLRKKIGVRFVKCLY